MKGGTNMEGTSRRRIGRQLQAYWGDNGRLLLFLSLFLMGVGIGCPAYSHSPEAVQKWPSLWLTYPASASAISGVLTAFGRVCLWPCLLLLMMMTAGLSTIGAPVVLAVPLLYGVSVGFTEAYVYSADGLWRMAWLLLPSTLVMLWTLLMSACESLRMTGRLIGQMTPHAISGSLWSGFKRYLLRYWIFAGLTLLAAAIQTLLLCIA